MDKVFISYAHNDIRIATGIKSSLEENGFNVWLDKRNIEGGKDWAQEINKGIDACYAVLVIVTNNSSASHYVTYEWAYALGAKKEVIPVIIEKVDKLHSALEKLQHIDLSDSRRRHGKREEIYSLLNKIKYDVETTDYQPPQDTEDETLIKLIKDLNNADPVVREETIKAMKKRGQKEVQAVLIQVLDRDQNDQVRAAAVTALGQFGTAPAKRRVIEALHSDKNRYARKAAAMVLKKMGEEQYIVVNLEKALKNDDSKIVRDEIMKSLKAIGKTESLAVIEKWKQKQTIKGQE